MLFIGLVGWHVGLNAGGYASATLGLGLSLLGALLPSSVLTLLQHLPIWALSAAAAWAVWATGVHLLWLLGASALLGALGWV